MDLIESILSSGSSLFGATDYALSLVAQASSEVAGSVRKGISGEQWILLLSAAAVLIVPFFVGNFLAKKLKMPTHGTRLGFVLLALLAAGVILVNKLPSLGVDLSGGTILVYEIDPEKKAELEASGTPVTSEDLIEPLTRRINPSGTQEIVIRPYGDSQIEIIVPNVESEEVERIKGLVAQAGQLRFAIVANQSQHQSLINQAVEQAASSDDAIATRQTVGGPEDSLYGRWVTVAREEKEDDNEKVRPLRLPVGGSLVRNPISGQIVEVPSELLGQDEEIKVAKWLETQTFNSLEILTVINSLLDITGQDLSYSASTFDQTGSPAVAFNLTDYGSGRFRALTTNNAPDASGRKSQLGIILDDELLSAPNILQPISKEGRITGNFTREEVDSLVAILKAGALPATVTKEPIAENTIDATLGRDTINKGVWAISASMILVLLFILYYYRFAGVVACIALLLNLALILATMVFINQPLTLPGLAGLVLTVGMSVDANVLIFERIREELKKGAKPRMAIRNGFSRATTTIVDANLTTLITAFVLYAIGTDQIRGFAVTLILGILYSMFTAIYMSRTLFDIAERHGFLSLSMSDGVNKFRSALAGGGQFNFVSKGSTTLALSAVLVLVGIGALFARGQNIFDIDFAGGSSVQFRVDNPTDNETIRAIVKSALEASGDETVQFTATGVTMDEVPDGTLFKVDSSIDNVDELKEALEAGFASNTSVGLVTYQADIKRLGSPSSGEQSRAQANNGVMLTALVQDEEDEATATTETGSATEQAEETPTEPVTTELELNLSVEGGGVATLNGITLRDKLVKAAESAGVSLNLKRIRLLPMADDIDDWNEESAVSYSDWQVTLPCGAADADQIAEAVRADLDRNAVWVSSSSVGARVAGDMIGRAFGALFASILCIIGYIWFRFQRVFYGLAAVAALIHDVLITLGAIAISYWLAGALGFLLIDPFKISLTVVAALLTIIGYSLNDTIVVFDRIRETKGKAPRLTDEMVNDSINQTLSRTLLTSVTTLIVVVLLYAFGGAGIHAFAFALVVGVLVGTYSSVFVASPILLWLLRRDEAKVAAARG
ncbi:MAG: protein translocase subunit SecD [Planctomycetota bacterium]